jgi:hypothetical protein
LPKLTSEKAAAAKVLSKNVRTGYEAWSPTKVHAIPQGTKDNAIRKGSNRGQQNETGRTTRFSAKPVWRRVPPDLGGLGPGASAYLKLANFIMVLGHLKVTFV